MTFKPPVPKLLDKQVRIFIYGAAGVGKAQPLDEPVLTPDGFKSIGDIHIGDYVIGEEGVPIQVIATQEHKDLIMYEVFFQDGRSTRCCEDHLWEVQTAKLRENDRYVVKPLRELIPRIINKPSTKNGYYYKTRVSRPVQYTEKVFPVDPYSLGYILGNGCSLVSSLQITTAMGDTQEILSNLGAGYIYRTARYKVDQSFITYEFRKKYEALGLYQVKSVDKWIPEEYLLGSVAQRTALLRGLMDSDGSCSNNKATFSSGSLRLATGVKVLVQSLGGRATLSTKDRGLKGVEHRVMIRTPFIPFLLKRKAEGYKVLWNDLDSINAISHVNCLGKLDGKCLTVASSRQLYLTKDFIVTHNSTTALSLLKNPKLKLVLLALEATTLEAVRNCFEVHQIEELLPGQLTLVVPDPAKAANEDAFKSNTDGTFFDNIVKALFAKSEATDVATGEAVKLKAFNQYDEDTVLIFDGVSALVETVTNRANSDALVKKVNDNGMAVYGIGQKYIIGLFNQLTKGTRAHVIVLGHQKMADDKAVAKYQGIKFINPDVYTRSLVDSICGMFSNVFYAKRNSLNNQFTLSVAEPQAYTRDAINRTKFKRVSEELNKSLKQHEKITLSALPTDLTSEVYDFLK